MNTLISSLVMFSESTRKQPRTPGDSMGRFVIKSALKGAPTLPSGQTGGDLHVTIESECFPKIF